MVNDHQEIMCRRLSSAMIKHVYGEKSRDPALLAMINSVFAYKEIDHLKSLKFIPVVPDGFRVPDHITRLEMICVGDNGIKYDVKLQFMANTELATKSLILWPLKIASWDENGNEVFADKSVTICFVPGTVFEHDSVVSDFVLTDVSNKEDTLDITRLIMIELGKYVDQYKKNAELSEFGKWCMYFSGIAGETLSDLARSDQNLASILEAERLYLSIRGK